MLIGQLKLCMNRTGIERKSNVKFDFCNHTCLEIALKIFARTLLKKLNAKKAIVYRKSERLGIGNSSINGDESGLHITKKLKLVSLPPSLQM